MPEVYAAVFDGHGGNATSEWLASNLLKYVEKYWQGSSAPEAAVKQAFLQADKVGRAAGRVGGGLWCAGVLCWWGVLGWRDQRAARPPACLRACKAGVPCCRRSLASLLPSFMRIRCLPAALPAVLPRCAATLPPGPQRILAPKAGFMGMVGERGIGGSKCGSTAAVAMLYKSRVSGERGGGWSGRHSCGDWCALVRVRGGEMGVQAGCRQGFKQRMRWEGCWEGCHPTYVPASPTRHRPAPLTRNRPAPRP